ncbi:MAG: hypothetical protein OXF61_00205 [Acidimicrobiaceae bacterium]|nr:hypothetical protein [Acidimicrobiaceae bacterium]
MSAINCDELHRTVKAVLDADDARDIADARRIVEGFVLQIHVGSGIAGDMTAQAALLTAVNAGHRAMLGGVRVVIDEDPLLSLPWVREQNLATAVRAFGGTVVDRLEPDRPVLLVCSPLAGHVERRQVQLNLVWNGWSGGVTDSAIGPRCVSSMPLAGVIAGALGVSEMFQNLRGWPTAGRRSVGLSLWRPDLDWCSPDAVGPTVRFAPDRLWLLGLGHLGQANAWNLGCLPYERPGELEVFLVDFDQIVEANWSTGLLTEQSDVSRFKTRVVSRRLESLGHRTRLVERRFDDCTVPYASEPKVALAGFDVPGPRRALGNKFCRVVDAGLGAGPTDYLDMLVHSFPSKLDPASVFADGPASERRLAAAYETEIKRRVASGESEGDARCGVIDLAGATAAASFVGAIAGALSVADLLRILHEGQHYATINLDLRSPNNMLTAFAKGVDQPINPGYTTIRELALPIG